MKEADFAVLDLRHGGLRPRGKQSDQGPRSGCKQAAVANLGSIKARNSPALTDLTFDMLRTYGEYSVVFSAITPESLLSFEISKILDIVLKVEGENPSAAYNCRRC